MYTEVRQQLDHGVWICYGESIPEGQEPAETPSNTGCVRGHMGPSGWVVVPVGSHKCHVTYITAVDAKVRHIIVSHDAWPEAETVCHAG